MKQEKEDRKIKRILPLTAGILAVLALIIVLFVPKGTEQQKEPAASAKTETGVSIETADAVTGIREDGTLVIYADRLSPDRISFIRIPDDSRIELLARLGEDGTAKAALGTCQSCNGSPGAYYTQEGGELKCNNCGLTFPISVLDSPGGGCHPIMMAEEIVRQEGADLVIDLEGLSAYEGLFAKVANH